MRAVYTSVYRIRGISPASAVPAREIVTDAELSLTALLTQDLEDRTHLVWKRVAISNGLLNGMFRGDDRDIEERAAAEVTKELERARARFRTGPFVVFTREGEVADFECEAETSRETFDCGIDGPIPDDFADASAQLAEDALTALSIEIPAVTGFDKVTSGVTYFRNGDKPFFAFRFRVGNARVEVLERVDDELWGRVGRAMKKVSGDENLGRVHRLLRSSLEQDKDRLRAFLSAWFGLEVLVGKIFSTYEASFFAQISAHHESDRKLHHVDRIREVMKDKYRLGDKFSLIATELGEKSADADLTTFKSCKAARDRLLHGQEVADSDLPVKETSELLRRYLSLHVDFDVEEQTVGSEPLYVDDEPDSRAE